MIAVFGPVRLRHPSFAVPAALGPGLLPGLWGVPVCAAGFTTPAPMIIRPVFDMGVRIGPGVLLHLVTMALQNLPGLAALRAAGYRPPARDR